MIPRSRYGFVCACARCKIEDALPDSDEGDDEEDGGEEGGQLDEEARQAKEEALEALQEQVCPQSLPPLTSLTASQ